MAWKVLMTEACEQMWMTATPDWNMQTKKPKVQWLKNYPYNMTTTSLIKNPWLDIKLDNIFSKYQATFIWALKNCMLYSWLFVFWLSFSKNNKNGNLWWEAMERKVRGGQRMIRDKNLTTNITSLVLFCGSNVRNFSLIGCWFLCVSK